LICYEAIFPGQAVDQNHRPGWLLNVTNDAWFSDSGGPYQHLAQARMRAVEQGLPLVRAANTGISALFDAYGRRRASLALNVQGVIDTPLPGALAATLYTRWGDYVYALLLFLIASAVLALRFAPGGTRKV